MLFYERLSKSSLVPAIVLGFATLLSTGLLPSTALAAPVIETSLASRSFGRLVERYSGKASGKIGDGGPSDTDYPSDDDINGAYIAPSGPFIFFSGIGDSQKPYEFSQTMPGSTILRGAFPKGYVTKGKPKRSGQWWVDFLDRISGAYTDKAVAAGQTVYFVGDFQATVSACSIWSRIELLTLKDAGIKIILVDYTDFQNKKDYPVDSSPHNTIGARNKDYCLDWEGSGEDPADPDSDDPHGPTYYPGSCGVHVRQYQKNAGPGADNTQYRLSITLKDDQQEIVGGLDTVQAPNYISVNVDSALPFFFETTAGAEDSDPISFAYAGQTWTSNDSQCSVGDYDSGSRQMDCGFTC